MPIPNTRRVKTATDVVYAARSERTEIELDRNINQIEAKLDALPANKERVIVALSIVSPYREGVRLSHFREIKTVVKDRNDNVLCQYPLSCHERPERAINLVELYRYKSQWKCRALGFGYEIGLPALSEAYGADEPVKTFGFETGVTPSSGTPGQSDKQFSGTGFCVNKEGFILTNHHVIDGATRIEARSTRQKLNCELIFSDKAMDNQVTFCINNQARVGESVMAIGYPLRGVLGSGPQVTTGNISSLIAPGDATHVLQFSAPVQSGNSGGPLLDAFGAISGMVYSKLNAATIHELTGDVPQNVNFAIKAYTLMMFLHSLGIEFITMVERKQQKSPEELAHDAARFVYQIICYE